jgi:hypothetical protein
MGQTVTDKSKDFDPERSERKIVVLLLVLGAVLALWVLAVGIIGLRP